MLTSTLQGFTGTIGGKKITKHRKHTVCISQISLWGIFLIVIVSHYMTLGVSSTCFDRDCFQFSNLCLSVLFHALWLLRFSRNNSCHGASHGLSEDALTPLFSRHNTTVISGNTHSVYYLIFTQLSLFYKKSEAFEALFTQGLNFRDHIYFANSNQAANVLYLIAVSSQYFYAVLNSFSL